MKNTAQIIIDDRFFEVAAAQSSRYPRLWTIAKETMQNSQDAGATEIRFQTDGQWVAVQDNGPGMGPTGGISNFLTIGASKKNENHSATGFFSTAKVRICFIHKDWSIHSGSEYLEKSMLGKESIQTDAEPVDGVLLKVQSKNGLWNTLEIADYVNLCNPEIAVYLNDRRLKRTFRKGGLKANFDWADVYVNRGDKAQKGQLIVRVNGLAMFTQRLSGVKAQVTVELDPQLSHRILQENREGLVWSAKYDDGQRFYPESELSRFVNGLIVNPSSAKPKSKTVVEFVKGRKRAVPVTTTRYGKEVETSFKAHTQTVRFRNAPTTKLTLKDVVAMLESGEARQASSTQGQPAEMMDGTLAWRSEDGTYVGCLPDDLELELLDTTDVVTLSDGTKGRFVPTVPSTKFDELFPFDYIVKHEGKRPTPHTKHARVLSAWKKLTEAIAEVGGISSKFGVGLCVDQDSKAEFVETPHGDFLLIDYKGIKMTGSQLAETMKMTRLACHELTHALGYSDHNEAFIIAEGSLYEASLNKLSALRAATKGLTIYSRGYGKEKSV